MSTSSVIWRPRPIIRPISIGIVRRLDEMLLMAILDDRGETKGWRPPGGSIEFGEHADQTLKREFIEEIGEGIRCLKQICVMENHYVHEGARGHEIVFVIEAAFTNPAAYDVERFEFGDGGMSWVKIEAFESGRQILFPEGLLTHLT